MHDFKFYIFFAYLVFDFSYFNFDNILFTLVSVKFLYHIFFESLYELFLVVSEALYQLIGGSY